MKELLLGCGHSRDKRLTINGKQLKFENLVTLDFMEGCIPDLVCDLDNFHWLCKSRSAAGQDALFDRPGTRFIDKQIKENYFSEVHAYEVLEHLGRQGDFRSFFSTFDNIYRVLIPGGYVFASVPSRFGPWLWGDPGHTRVITSESLSFLDQTNYSQCGHTTMTDYRFMYQSDFRLIWSDDDKVTYRFILQAIKPARKSI